MQLDLNQIQNLLTSLHQTDISELTLKGSDFELVVRRGYVPSESGQPTVALIAAPSPNALPVVPVAPVPAAPGATAPTAPPSNRPENWVEITSPMVGTFYRAPTPDEAPFVSVGDRVKQGQTVCIIEAMKLMNDLEAEVAGEIVEILVENGKPVEFNQPLMRIIPA
ncbi:acetyl-CoA carboxylase biotin carboxyl carrier protein [Prochlorothrix hollandica]|uniref:Biotin carboxyl carrier protein of acetyl-CoA carboxylase n=1 Tax=Prochlorothrix hollandica PCC 9006 = CALU 1027 TaxID=317619 RepID=A0A0M2PW03_PROHO|nr:acetyl-CoA carboxylase biotin carboxyl carrier protein [Prochlorothrix hollandica]KKI98551.1 acetyl-CoA carboxylase [Prochlorothrix hollandica PCC 9006 = CALU 1027]